MINRIQQRFVLTTEQYSYIDSKKPHSGVQWDKPDSQVKAIKQSIRSQLEGFQNNNCAYCGLTLKGTAYGEIDHIAPKASKKYPQFTFDTDNLVLSCDYCNSANKKGQRKTILKFSPVYSNCKFYLVHPYYDDHCLHYSWNGVVIKSKSKKAKWSIICFELYSLRMTEARAAKRIFEISRQGLTQENIRKIEDIQKYKEHFNP